MKDITVLATISEKLTQPQYARKWTIIWESHCNGILNVNKLKLHKSMEDTPKKFVYNADMKI